MSKKTKPISGRHSSALQSSGSRPLGPKPSNRRKEVKMTMAHDKKGPKRPNASGRWVTFANRLLAIILLVLRVILKNFKV
jgi:hypothetical protein